MPLYKTEVVSHSWAYARGGSTASYNYPEVCKVSLVVIAGHLKVDLDKTIATGSRWRGADIYTARSGA